tara:strand:- start:835 stop:1083 length:249 start_codon:yes stop_codon:yes gene_type:complete
MKQQDTSKEMVLTEDEMILLRKALRMLDDSVEAEENKAIDILNEVRGDDDDKTLEYFKAYQKRLSKKAIAIRKLRVALIQEG